MKIQCPRCQVVRSRSRSSLRSPRSPDSGPIVRNGVFYRRSDSRRIERFFCKACTVSFSQATAHPCFRQKRRRINGTLKKLLCEGVSQRGAARVLRVNRKTVVRRFRFLAEQARAEQERWLKSQPRQALTHLQWDDLETSEHSKCKPVSVALAVDPTTRKILSFEVSRMPAKGHLARLARKKYGPRPDERPQGWRRLMNSLQPVLSPQAEILSDSHPHYPRVVQRAFPQAVHVRVPGRRGCVVGQGELKEGGFDPLFALNHTFAMLRAHLNRLFRRTWCTTKTLAGLRDHIDLYVAYHNFTLTPSSTLKGGSL